MGSVRSRSPGDVRFLLEYSRMPSRCSSRNQVTPADSLVYLIVKIVVLIAQPVRLELVLRKRLAVTMGKSESWWSGKALKNYLGYVSICSYL